MKCTTLLLSVCVAALGVASVVPARAQAPNSAPARRIVIKVGTLAPEGTPWHDALQEIGATWKKASGGQITPLLELGVSTETFGTNGGAGLVQTSSVQVPSTMLADQVSERPLSSRNVVNSTMFLPGVTPARADSRISNVRLAGAAVVSVYLGLGVGHAIIGYGKAGLFWGRESARGSKETETRRHSGDGPGQTGDDSQRDVLKPQPHPHLQVARLRRGRRLAEEP